MMNIDVANQPYEVLEEPCEPNPRTIAAHGDMFAIELALDNLGHFIEKGDINYD